MTMQEVIENELKCVQRDCCRLENECAKCDLVLPKEEIINAYNKALKLEEENASIKTLIEEQHKVGNDEFWKSVWYIKRRNVELEEENKKWKDEWQEQVQKANDEGFARTLQTIQLTQAKEIIKLLLWDLRNRSYQPLKDIERAEQFLKESE